MRLASLGLRYAIGLLALGAGFTGCATNRIDTLWYPPPAAWQRGAEEGIALLNRDETIRRLDARLVHRLQDVLDRMRAASGVEAELAIADAAQANAYAFQRQGKPYVAVSLFLLDALGHDDDALAATLGHELAHVRLGHLAARVERAHAAQAAIQGVGTLLTAVGMPVASLMAGVGLSGIHAAYSRDEERAADALSLAWAAAAGFNVCGAVRTVRVLEKASAPSTAIPFLAMHPGAEERLHAAQAMAMDAAHGACAWTPPA